MSDTAAPTPDVQVPGPAAQRRISGFVIFSILLTIGSFLLPQYLFILGPFAGLALGFIGWRAAKKNPLIIGPLFALGATGFAVLVLCFQSYILYRNYPALIFRQEVGKKADEVLRSMEARKFDEVYGALDEEAKTQTTVEEMKAVFEKSYPEGATFPLAEQWKVAEGELDADDFQKRLVEFLEAEGGEFRFVLPIQPDPEDEQTIVHLRLRAVRPERTTVNVTFLGFTLERKKALAATDVPATGTGAADVEKPATGTGSEPEEGR